MLRKLFGAKAAQSYRPAPSLPEGERIYAIGDVHGCLTELNDLLDNIDTDARTAGATAYRIIFLGDLINRGPDPRGVVERVMALPRDTTMLLCGNHEELLVGLWEGNAKLASVFHRAGGRSTMLSYGVTPDTYDEWSLEELANAVANAIPQDHIAFLKEAMRASHCRAGDYLFVHAGIRPGIPLEQQKAGDLRWIRDEFVSSEVDHGMVVVHGHSIVPTAEVRANRIAVDTGAFQSGNLTAVGLEGEQVWFVDNRCKSDLC